MKNEVQCDHFQLENENQPKVMEKVRFISQVKTMSNICNYKYQMRTLIMTWQDG